MKLWLKFNLAFLAAFVVSLVATGVVSDRILQENAREEVLETAGIIMEGAMAVRGYTIEEIRPLLAPHMGERFLPQTVPAYAATNIVARLRQEYPDYSYKEATLNPTNPSSRATEWESGMVDHFRNHGEIEELVGAHDTAAGRKLYIGRPIRVESADCLACHGEVSAAPEAMVARYGDANGFGWQMDEVVGAQIVSVPMEVALSRARETLVTFLVSMAAVLLFINVLLNVLLYRIVIRPIRTMSGIAHDVSMGRMDVPEYELAGRDEVASLSRSFNRMRRSLVNAMRMIDE